MACQAKLARAVALYQGDLLAGFHINHALFFEEWLHLAQGRYREQTLSALQALLIGHFKRGVYGESITFARRHIQLEPWQEIGWQHLMLALSAQGNGRLALNEYEACCRLFLDNLSIAPSVELSGLYKKIQTAEKIPALSDVNPYKGLHTFTEADAAYFFGREEAVQQLTEKLEQFGFAAIVAPSGGGKSSMGRVGWCIGKLCKRCLQTANYSGTKDSASSLPALVHRDQHVADMRRLMHSQDANGEQWRIAQKLANARLLVARTDENGGGMVELAHEILIRYWYRFRYYRRFHLTAKSFCLTCKQVHLICA